MYNSVKYLSMILFDNQYFIITKDLVFITLIII